MLLIHVLFGLVITSWSFFVAAPFGKSPQLAAVVTTFLAIILAVFGVVIKSNSGGFRFILSILFPPTLYIFSLKTIASYEALEIATNIVKGDPTHGQVLLPLIIAGIVSGPLFRAVLRFTFS